MSQTKIRRNYPQRNVHFTLKSKRVDDDVELNHWNFQDELFKFKDLNRRMKALEEIVKRLS